jgi:hypothetical protein
MSVGAPITRAAADASQIDFPPEWIFFVGNPLDWRPGTTFHQALRLATDDDQARTYGIVENASIVVQVDGEIDDPHNLFKVWVSGKELADMDDGTMKNPIELRRLYERIRPVQIPRDEAELDALYDF